MLRGLPNKMTSTELMDILDALGFEGAYDYFYLPCDLRSSLSNAPALHVGAFDIPYNSLPDNSHSLAIPRLHRTGRAGAEIQRMQK